MPPAVVTTQVRQLVQLRIVISNMVLVLFMSISDTVHPSGHVEIPLK